MDRIGPTPEIRPGPTLGRRLDAIARACFPVACTVLLMLLTTLPFGLLDQGQLLPAVTLACVWFWSLYRPASVPPLAVFALGLLLDLLGYLPIGVGALVLLAAQGVADRLRRFLVRQGFAVVWLTYIAVAAGAAALVWGLASLLVFQLMPQGAAVFQFLLSAALYPVLATLFIRAHRT